METSQQYRARALIVLTENGKHLPEIRKRVRAGAVDWGRESFVSMEPEKLRLAVELTASQPGNLAAAKSTIQDLAKVETFGEARPANGAKPRRSQNRRGQH